MVKVSDEEIREMAKARVCFKVHLMVYIVINLFFAVLSYCSGLSFSWNYYIAVPWGLALIFHGLFVYYGPSEKALEDKEYVKLKKQFAKK